MKQNKTKQVVVWPTTPYFTIQQLVKLNQKMLTVSGSDITIRVRLVKEIESGKLVEIGSTPGVKGRPQKMFSRTPITNNMLDDAESKGITLVDRAREKLINVISVNTPQTLYKTNSIQSPVTSNN